MKVHEILFEEVADDFHISDKDMEVAFKAVSKGKLDQRDIKGLSMELADEAMNRTPGSFAFIINRLHVLLYGEAPSGFTERSAEKMFNPSSNMVKFAKEKGIDVEDSIQRAKIELKNRKVKVKQPEARQMWLDAAKSLESSFDPRKWAKEIKPLIIKTRDAITREIMAGEDPRSLFKQLIPELR